MTHPKFVGIMGAKRAGKDTVAMLLGSQLSLRDIPHQRMALADGLKLELADLFGTTVLEIERRKTDPRMRWVLQHYGTEYARVDRGPDCWITALLERVEREGQPNSVILVPDVRFPNEGAFIRSQGGIIVRVSRIEADIVADAHPSENEWRTIKEDYGIANNGTMTELTEDVKYVAECAFGKLGG